MTALEEVKRMKAEGLKEEAIVHALRDKGVAYRDIADALAQTEIKAAVEAPDASPEPEVPLAPTPEPIPEQPYQEPLPSAGSQEYFPQAPSPYTAQPEHYQNQYQEPNQYQQQYSSAPASADLITEISEQIVTEKLGDIRKHLEKVIDMRTTVESKMEYLDERIKKIEKIIDTLQSSVLRKVGDYVTNVQDIKNELVETQKTFSKLVSAKKGKHDNK